MIQEIYWYTQSNYPLLLLLQLVPLCGALVVWVFQDRPWVIWVARGIALIELLIAVRVYLLMEPFSSALQFAERLDLPGPLNYHTGADGITVIFLLTSSLLVLMISFYSLVRGLHENGRLLAVVLALEAVLISALTTTNLLWFVVVCCLELGLMGYLVWYWGTSEDRSLALYRFYHFQIVGLFLLFLGTLIAGANYADVNSGVVSYELQDLVLTTDSAPLAKEIFVLLFLGLAIRAPLFPFHGWLPTVARHGNIALAPAFLLGVKISMYGMVRYLLPMQPSVAMQAGSVILGTAVVGIFYAAVLAFQQTNLRQLLAYAVVSHTSLLVIGIFSLDNLALQGSMLLSVTFGLGVITMLFMVGLVYRRTRTSNLSRLGGLFDRIPLLGIAFFVGGLAIMCMPGTPGFDAAHLVFEGAMKRFGALVTVAAALGNVVAAGYLLWAFQRAFLAPAPDNRYHPVDRACATENLIAIVMILVLLVAGFYMEPWLALVEAPLQAIPLTPTDLGPEGGV